MSKLLEFFTDLATDPQKQLAFASNPQAIIKDANLSVEARALVLNRNGAKIASSMKECPQLAIFFTDPGPDPDPDSDPPQPDFPSEPETN